MSWSPFDPKRIPFEGYPEPTRKLYQRMLLILAMNLEAYKRQYFDIRFCDTEDTYTWFRFAEAMPNIKLWLDLDSDLESI